MDVYVALHYSSGCLYRSGKPVSLAANLFHSATALVTALPVADLARGGFHVAAAGALVVFFRPLLTGIGRALVLTVRPRPSRAQQAARRARQEAARG